MSALIPAGDILNSRANQDTGKKFWNSTPRISSQHFIIIIISGRTRDPQTPTWTALHKWRSGKAFLGGFAQLDLYFVSSVICGIQNA